MSRDTPANLPPQAKARQHSQWARCETYYQHVWRFELDGEPPTEDEYSTYTDECDGYTLDNLGVKYYFRDGELTIMVRTGQGPGGGGPGNNAISPTPKGNP